jgi:alpha-beta hydrolase superfamily lysophospholipase
LESGSPAIRRYERSVASGSEALFRRGWTPENARACALVVHGYAEHSGRYEHVGHWLAEHGYSVHAYDQRGHGRSSGRRCHVDRFDEYLDDLALVLDHVRAEEPDLPVFLIGHSMGGLVVATFARERKPSAAGVVLSGAALAVPEGGMRARVWAARAIRALLPRLRLSAGLDLDGLASDPSVREAYLADPLVERKMTASLAAELMSAVERTGPNGGDVALPLLALHGADDSLCAASGSERFAAAAPVGRFIRYPGLRHEIFNEPVYRDVLADVAAFFEERLAALGSARA